jgi:hypothetical protein
VIFSRDRGSGRHASEQSRRTRRTSGRDAADKREAVDDSSTDIDRDDLDDSDPANAATAGRERRGAGARAPGSGGAAGAGPALDGPYDISEAPEGVDRLDLGSLQIPVVEDVAVRVQANNEGVVQQVALTYQDSALVLAALAAPRDEDIWEEVRAEIRKELTAGGARVTDVEGEFGPELRTRVNTPEGAVELRFVGIAGERWLLRAIYQGAAAADPSVAGPLRDCLGGVVVDRGREAMPVMEMLPLRLPRELAEQAKAQAEAAGAAQPPTNGVSPPGATRIQRPGGPANAG